MKRILSIVPMYKNGGMKDKDERHGKPVNYEVHDVTDEYVTRFPIMLDDDGTQRQTLQSEVTFKTAEKAQAWIDTQMEREKSNG